MSRLAATALLALSILGLAATQDAKPARVGLPYMLPTCVISGETLGDDAVVVILEGQKKAGDNGREIKFCCAGCAGQFRSNPAEYLSKINAEMVKQQLAWYPPVNCPVMTDESMPAADGPDAGEAKNVIWQNRLVRLCCSKCLRRFNAEPDKYLAALDAMIIAQGSKNYPMTTCPVSGEPLGDKPVDVVAANRLVKVCCKGCVRGVEKDPMKYAAMVAEASKKAAAAPSSN